MSISVEEKNHFENLVNADLTVAGVEFAILAGWYTTFPSSFSTLADKLEMSATLAILGLAQLLALMSMIAWHHEHRKRRLAEASTWLLGGSVFAIFLLIFA